MHPLRRIRIAFATRRLLYWTFVAALAAATGLFVQSRAVALDRARHRLGATVPVLVADHGVAAGSALGSGDVRVVAMPVAFAPPGAVVTLPADARATAAIGVGEVLTSARLVAQRSALAARLDDSRRAVAIARGDRPLSLAPGDRVDVIGTSEGFAPRVVCAAAPVLAVDDEVVTVAVPVADEAMVAAIAAGGGATLALAP